MRRLFARAGARAALTAPCALVLGLHVAAAAAAPRRGAPPAPPPAPAPATSGPVLGPMPGAPRASEERRVEASAARSPVAPGVRGARPKSGVPRPTLGPRVPEAMRASLAHALDARVARDLRDIAALRREALGLLTTFVDETPPGSRELPEALLRLGELEWEDERESFARRFEAWEKLPAASRGPTPAPDYERPRRRFARVLREFKGHSSYDLALYVDGFLATEQGKDAEALERFDRLLAEYPRSRFVADAHLARAEHLFAVKGDYQAALGEYEKVLEHADSELYGLALFKSAWCLWRLGRSEEAAARFVKVFEVTGARGAAQVGQRKQLDELENEALKYLVEVFTEDEKNTAQDVYRFLVKVGGDKFAGKIVRALAEQFYDQAHYERGVEAYELLLKLEPASPEAGRRVLAIADGQATLEDWPKEKATYARATAGYLPGGAWARSQGDPEVVRATARAIEAQIFEHAQRLHARGQKDRSRAELEGAAGLYDVYLASFAAEPRGWQASFYLAEIESFHLARPTDAARHYLAAARTMPAADAAKEPGRTQRHDALYNALAALERVRQVELDARKKVLAAGAPAPPESESDKAFAEALDLYAQLYPDDPALAELFFRQGRASYDAGAYDPAVKIFGALLERFPKSPYARDAGELILDSFARSKNYETIEAWARRLKSAPAFQAPDAQKRLDGLVVQAVFKQGEQKSQAGEHAAAARAYLRAAREFPKDPRAAQACVNAGLEAQKAGDLAAIKEAAALVTSPDYRDRPESPQGAWHAANTLQAMGLFADAAELHETIFQLSTKDHPSYQRFDHARESAFDAVVLRQTLGEHDKAVALGSRYLATYGAAATGQAALDADEVTFQMGRAHQAAGRDKDAVELYRRYVGHAKGTDRRVQGLVLLGLAQVKAGDEPGASASFKEAATLGKRRRGELSAAGKYAAARARYLEGERVLARFDALRIEGDAKQLAKRLKQKADLLKQASSVFLDTVGYGVAEWSTAALYQIGRTYESFAKALREAPAPSGLSEADREAYQSEIDAFVVPVEERSLDAYENGWKKAIELGIYNGWTARMREALGRLNGELYPPVREIGLDVRARGPEPLPPLYDAPRAAGAARTTPAPATSAKAAAPPARGGAR